MADSRQSYEVKAIKSKIYLLYSEQSHCIRNDYGHDGPYTGYSEAQIETTFIGLQREKPNSESFLELELPFHTDYNEVLSLVIVKYKDGGTFGCTHGYWCVDGVYQTNRAAQAHAKAISEKPKPRDYDEYAWKPWSGYFARIETIDAIVLPIINNSVNEDHTEPDYYSVKHDD